MSGVFEMRMCHLTIPFYSAAFALAREIVNRFLGQVQLPAQRRQLTPDAAHAFRMRLAVSFGEH